jgi:hypothetical protein
MIRSTYTCDSSLSHCIFPQVICIHRPPAYPAQMFPQRVGAGRLWAASALQGQPAHALSRTESRIHLRKPVFSDDGIHRSVFASFRIVRDARVVVRTLSMGETRSQDQNPFRVFWSIRHSTRAPIRWPWPSTITSAAASSILDGAGDTPGQYRRRSSDQRRCHERKRGKCALETWKVEESVRCVFPRTNAHTTNRRG